MMLQVRILNVHARCEVIKGKSENDILVLGSEQVACFCNFLCLWDCTCRLLNPVFGLEGFLLVLCMLGIALLLALNLLQSAGGFVSCCER